ncbi:MAG: histidine kinase [Owenweeksia sp.]|nr:histidine kinase [Owenweeksia sp.]
MYEEAGLSVLEKRLLPTGRLEETHRLDAFYNHLLLREDQLLLGGPGRLMLMDEDFGLVRQKEDERIGHSGDLIDLDGDGKKEYLTGTSYQSGQYFFSAELDHPVEINMLSPGFSHFFVMQAGTDQPQLVLRAEEGLRFYKYRKNPWYWLRLPYYLAIFLLAGVASHLLFKRFRQNIENRYEQERKLNRLQLLSIKNQVDPHFTLNALNSIDWMYRNNEPAKASSFMGKLSRLMHQTVLNSDKISSSLWEELDFCRNYCELEKLREEQFYL